MESLRLLLLLVFLCTLDFDSATGKFQIYSSPYQILMKSSKCDRCLILSRSYLELFDPDNIRMEKTPAEFTAISKTCRKHGGILGHFHHIFGPFLNRASKWCGNNDDKAVKNCCHERLKCPVKLERSWVKKHLKQDVSLTTYSRDCEKKFVNCLKEVGNTEAKKVFKYRFRVFPAMILIYDHPINCKHKKKIDKTTKSSKKLDCTKDEEKPKRWQIKELSTGIARSIDFPTNQAPWEIQNNQTVSLD